MEQRFYFDTSVFGGLFDAEFEEETALLFEKVTLGQIKCVYSNLTESEFTNAPEKVRNYFEAIKDEFKEKIFVTPEGLKLAQTYVDEYCNCYFKQSKYACKLELQTHRKYLQNSWIQFNKFTFGLSNIRNSFTKRNCKQWKRRLKL